MWHEGQFEGRRVRPPVFLSRRSDEPPDLDLADWHRRLLAAVAGTKVRAGLWRLLDANGWPDNQSCRNLLAWSWTSDEARHLVVVNLSAEPARGRIPLGWPDLPGRSWHLTSLLDDNALERDGAELADPGLFVALEPWQSYLLTLG